MPGVETVVYLEAETLLDLLSFGKPSGIPLTRTRTRTLTLTRTRTRTRTRARALTLTLTLTRTRTRTRTRTLSRARTLPGKLSAWVDILALCGLTF